VTNVPSYPSDAAEREAEVATPAAERDYAGWWSRVGALLIDTLLLAVPFVAIIVAVAATADENDDAAWGLAGVAYLLSFVVPFVYFTFMHGGERGQTIGKRATGIRVVDKDGGRLGHGRALGRYAFMFVLGIFAVPLLLDYLWPLWDDKNQALHDKVVNSLVVRA
jgi:uncharacterized RDD family membrane protein YckC